MSVLFFILFPKTFAGITDGNRTTDYKSSVRLRIATFIFHDISWTSFSRFLAYTLFDLSILN